nr:hypothetical protein [Nocardioides litoris]
MRELASDVLALGRRPVLVDRREDAARHLARRGVVDVLRGGDQLNACSVHLQHDESVIDAVPVEPAELVDHDVLDVTLGADALHHRLVLRTVLDRRRAAPGLDVLGHDG